MAVDGLLIVDSRDQGVENGNSSSLGLGNEANAPRLSSSISKKGRALCQRDCILSMGR